MRRLTVSDVAEQHLTEWLEGLMAGNIPLWALPPSVAAFYQLGFHEGFTTTPQAQRIQLLEHENERLWVLAHNKQHERREEILRRLDEGARFDWNIYERKMLELLQTRGFGDATQDVAEMRKHESTSKNITTRSDHTGTLHRSTNAA